MKRFTALLKLDFLLIVRNNILTISFIITAFYIAAFKLLAREDADVLYIILIFTDPVMLGFMFTGVLVLFEKMSGTIKAIWVSPVSPDAYLWSKSLCLAFLALFCSVAMIFAAKGFHFNIMPFVWAVVFSSLLFVFLGYAGVSKVNTFNQYVLVLPLAFMPACLPFLNFFGLTDWLIWYIFPTQASLILFDHALGGIYESWEIIYAYVYLPLCTFFAWVLARRFFVNNINK